MGSGRDGQRANTRMAPVRVLHAGTGQKIAQKDRADVRRRRWNLVAVTSSVPNPGRAGKGRASILGAFSRSFRLFGAWHPSWALGS